MRKKDIKSKEKLPFWYIPAWSSRSISTGMGVVLLAQVTFYCTDIVGIDSAVVGMIILISKVVDAIAELTVGYIIDRTNTKIGKARPYELFIIPLWVFIVMLFATPEMGNTGKIIYIFVFYTLINSVCTTFLSAAGTVYLGRAFQDNTMRGKIVSFSGFLITIFSAAGGILLPLLMNSWGTQPGGWTRIAIVYAIPMTLLGIIRFLTIKEYPVENKNVVQGKLGIKESIHILSKNKYLFIITAVILLANFIQNTISVTGTYYFNYLIGDLDLMSLVGLVGMIGPFILLLFPAATKTIGAVNFVRIGMVISLLASLVRFFFPTVLPLVYISVMLSGTGVSTVMVMQSYFVLQCIDYGEKRTGKRVEGMPSSISNFAKKIGIGLASVSFGILMSISGYDRGSQLQSGQVISMIRGLYSLIPAAICMIILIILHFYDIEKN